MPTHLEKKLPMLDINVLFGTKHLTSQNVAAPQSHLLEKHEMNINSVLLSCEKNKTM